MGAGIGGLETIEDNYGKLSCRRRPQGLTVLHPGPIINMTSGHVSIL